MYAYHSISFKLYTFGLGALNLFCDLSDYFLPIFSVGGSELGGVPFQYTHMFVCQFNVLAKHTLLF